jgi:hypothetical protein
VLFCVAMSIASLPTLIAVLVTCSTNARTGDDGDVRDNPGDVYCRTPA